MSLFQFFSLLVCVGILNFNSSFSQNIQKDKEEISTVINKFFDGLREGDSTKVKSVFHKEGRLSPVSEKGEVMHITVNDFAGMVGKPRKEVWDERIFDVTIETDGRIGSVWCKYSFYVGENFSHCGVDAFQLVKGDKGWQIIQISDTRNKENCDEHKKRTAK